MDLRRARELAEHMVFIYCDDASHPKRVTVTSFARINGGWIDVPTSRASASGYMGTGRTIVGDDLPEPGWALEPTEGAVRDRHELVCRKCKRRPVPVKVDTLHPALDKIAAAGESEIPLSGMAAILRMQSQQ